MIKFCEDLNKLKELTHLDEKVRIREGSLKLDEVFQLANMFGLGEAYFSPFDERKVFWQFCNDMCDNLLKGRSRMRPELWINFMITGKNQKLTSSEIIHHSTEYRTKLDDIFFKYGIRKNDPYRFRLVLLEFLKLPGGSLTLLRIATTLMLFYMALNEIDANGNHVTTEPTLYSFDGAGNLPSKVIAGGGYQSGTPIKFRE